MKKLIGWCRANYLVLFALFFLAFIPLYPKLPLLDVFQTWVYIRLEDFLVLVVDLVLLFLIIRSPKRLNTPLTVPISFYWTIGLASSLFAILFLVGKVNGMANHLILLHFARRIEYMSLFFLGYLAFRNKVSIKPLILVLSVTAFAVRVYGLGQKFLGWPAFLTMNEEFAKGVPLRLPPTARIASTFGGHYDLAAYTVLLIPIFTSLIFAFRNKLLKLAFGLLSLFLYVMLLYTASRVSWGMYILSMCVLFVWLRKKLLIIPFVVVSVVMMQMTSGASERFIKTLRYSDVIVDATTGRPIGTLDEVKDGKAVVQSQEKPDEESLPHGTGFIGVPQKSDVQSVKTIEYFRKSALATGSGDIATVSGSFFIQKAFVYDISLTTRFQGQWPKAIEAFKRNLLLGSGFSSLSVAADGDYMRMLGETGVLGTVALLGIFFYSMKKLLGTKDFADPVERAFVVGVAAGTLGLLLNAVLIDVFEASKIAFYYWLLLGVAFSLVKEARTGIAEYFRFIAGTLFHQRLIPVYLFIGTFLLFAPSIGMYFVADDFTWLRWVASVRIPDYPSFFTVSDGFFYRPLSKIWYALLYMLFWLMPHAYHIASISLFAGTVVMIYAVLRQLRVRWYLAAATSVWFAVMSVHHENIYWISGASSLLGTFFLTGSLLMLIRFRMDTMARWMYLTGGYVLLFLAMLSYDSLLLAPVAVAVSLGLIVPRKRLFMIPMILMVPLYWYIRSQAHALAPSGDYAVNIAKLPYNIVGNIATYILSTVGGADAILGAESWRQMLRTNLGLSAILIASGLLTALAVSALIRKAKLDLAESLMFLLGGIIVSVGFAGLGGAAERYALVFTLFLAVSAGLVAEATAKRAKSIYPVVVIGVLFTLLIGKNFTDLKIREAEWAKASDITNTTLLTLKDAYFPLRGNTRLIFVNTPIRYGRAWIFPTGLDDALWHIFKFNSYAMHVASAPTIEMGHNLPGMTGVEPFVLEFDSQYRLSRSIKDVQVVEEK